jgi:hypothetical protein
MKYHTRVYVSGAHECSLIGLDPSGAFYLLSTDPEI